MSEIKYGFIGTGNMGGTLVAAAAKAVNADCIYISDRNETAAKSLAERVCCNLAEKNEWIAKNCDIVFLGVKPQVLPSLIKEILPALKKRADKPLLVSMAAGVSLQTLSELTLGAFPIIRIMPNTPAAVGEGMMLYAVKDASKEQTDAFLEAVSLTGRVDLIPEQLIDAASAVSGCAPAFVYMFIEALADAGVKCGLPRDKAIEYAAQTVKGAAKNVLESGVHPAQLKDAVCSPSGSTIEGVNALENGGFRGTCMNAVTAAYEKTVKLSEK